jgi:hypothetical protein
MKGAEPPLPGDLTLLPHPDVLGECLTDFLSRPLPALHQSKSSPHGFTQSRTFEPFSVRCEVFPGRSVGDPFDDDYGVGPEIPSRKTRKVSIHFHVNIHLQRPGKALTVRFAVTDQLSEEHRMPTITIQTIDMTPER